MRRSLLTLLLLTGPALWSPGCAGPRIPDLGRLPTPSETPRPPSPDVDVPAPDEARPPTPADGVGCLVGDCRDGYGALRFESGLTYEGMYADGEPNGAGRWLWPSSAFWPDGATDGGTWARGTRQETLPPADIAAILVRLAETGGARFEAVSGRFGEPTLTLLGWQPSRWCSTADLCGYRIGPAPYARVFEGEAVADAVASARPTWRRLDADGSDEIALADCDADSQRTVVFYRDVFVSVYTGQPDDSIPDPCR